MLFSQRSFYDLKMKIKQQKLNIQLYDKINYFPFSIFKVKKTNKQTQQHIKN